MTVLVDECVPFKLVQALTGHDFATAQAMGWGGFKNGQLLALAEREFDLFLSADLNLQYQQNLKSPTMAILLLSTNHWPTLKRHVPLIQSHVDRIRPREVRRLDIPRA